MGCVDKEIRPYGFLFGVVSKEAQGRERGCGNGVCGAGGGWVVGHRSEGEMGEGRRNGLWRLAGCLDVGSGKGRLIAQGQRCG